MKKQSFRYLAGVVTAVVFFTSLHAQHQNSVAGSNSGEPASNKFNEHSSKKDAHTVLLNERALNNFSDRYKEAGTPSGYSIKNGFLVQSDKDGVHTRAFYDLKGRWTSTIRNYGQNKLPADVRKQVRSTYYDYNIYLVNEITVGSKTVYLVSIQDDAGYKTIRVTDEETTVFDEFLRQ